MANHSRRGDNYVENRTWGEVMGEADAPKSKTKSQKSQPKRTPEPRDEARKNGGGE